MRREVPALSENSGNLAHEAALKRYCPKSAELLPRSY